MLSPSSTVDTLPPSSAELGDATSLFEFTISLTSPASLKPDEHPRSSTDAKSDKHNTILKIISLCLVLFSPDNNLYPVPLCRKRLIKMIYLLFLQIIICMNCAKFLKDYIPPIHRLYIATSSRQILLLQILTI